MANIDLCKLLEIGVSAFVPIFVMAITLKVTADIYRKGRAQADEHQKKSETLLKKQHKEDLREQNDQKRVMVLPFLSIKNIEPAYEERIKKTFLILHITFVNSGTGMAVGVQSKYLSEDISEYLICPIHKTEKAIYCCDAPVDAAPTSNTVQLGASCELDIRRELQHDFENDVSDRITLTMQFDDVLGNSYEQEFEFLMGRYRLNSNPNIQISQVHTSAPKIVEKEN